jgi:hypothetical protein
VPPTKSFPQKVASLFPFGLISEAFIHLVGSHIRNLPNCPVLGPSKRFQPVKFSCPPDFSAGRCFNKTTSTTPATTCKYQKNSKRRVSPRKISGHHLVVIAVPSCNKSFGQFQGRHINFYPHVIHKRGRRPVKPPFSSTSAALFLVPSRVSSGPADEKPAAFSAAGNLQIN